MRTGPLILDTGFRQLRRGSRVLPVSGLPLRIFEMLTAANGRIVSRQELKAALWPYAVRIDVDRRLNTAVRALRKEIGDGQIVTVRGYGYRWVASSASPSAGWPRYLAIGPAAVLLVSAPVYWAAEPLRSNRPVAAEAVIGAAELRLSTYWDWRGAEALYRQALATDPNSSEAHRGLAWLYVNDRRAADALPHIAKLLEAPDPKPARRAELGWLLMRAGSPDAALAICSKPDERTLNLLSCRHTALAQLGLIPEARETALELLRVAGAEDTVIRDVGEAAPAAGYAMFLRWRVAHFVAPNRDWFQRAQLQAEAGLYGEALHSLEIAAEGRDPLLVKIGSTAAFAPLQSSPRFRRISEIVLGA
jgi:hypothetical protein